ncbi:MmgE/PrpD family protein [Thermodesulfobacteriota bacterium]
MNIVEELVGNVLEKRFEHFDEPCINSAKDRIIDIVGCLISGANASGCSMLLDLVREWGGREESTIMIHGDRVPAHNAAMVNSVIARSFDFEPAGPFVEGKGTPGHLSGTTVPTAIAVAEQKSASGKELLTALILGDDIASRIVAASQFNLDSGWDCTGTVNVFGAAAIAGRLWGLSNDQLLNAFGIALNQMAGTFQNLFDGTHSFKLPQGLASRAGIMSVELAGKGFTSVKDPLLSKHGYFSLYCTNYQPEILTNDLGKVFCADQTFKPYPCCRSTHAAIDCVLEILRKTEIDPGKILSVKVDVSPLGYDFVVGQPFKIGSAPQVNAVFSLQYTVANAILRKDVKLEHFDEEAIRDPKISDFIKKIKLTPLMPPELPLSAAVTIKMNDGQEYYERVDIPKGNDVQSPLTEKEKREKFWSNVAFSKTITEEKAGEALELLERIEEVNKISGLINLLIA